MSWGIDFILLHPPSVYDFRKEPIFWGPIADVVPSSVIFEMYPVGFVSISALLNQHKIKTKIINLAYLMLKDSNFNVEDRIKNLNPIAFGIDLHWLCHAHGSIEIARICKKYHPDIPVILGGYSATFFYNEIMQKYHEIDFIVRGDSTEEYVLELLKCIRSGKPVDDIHNLTWRDEGGKIRSTPIENPPIKLTKHINNYNHMFSMALKNMDIESQMPFLDWWHYPITAIMTVRGCTQNCAICGGSSHTMNKLCHRKKPSYRPVEFIINDIRQVSNYCKGPIFLIGDINQPGEEYANKILNGLAKLSISNQIVLELFKSANEDFFKRASDACINLNFEMSPESHDESIRKLCGKNYSTQDMENNIKWALNYGAKKFDLYFMTGIPGQDVNSVMKTIDYCESLMNRFDNRLMPFISPLAPFIDPNSKVWDNPAGYGYKLFCKTFDDHRRILLNPSWKYILSYETKWMSRDQIVNVTYKAAKVLNNLKIKYGQIEKEVGYEIAAKIDRAIELIKKIDVIVKYEKNEVTRKEKLNLLKNDMKDLSYSTICKDDEIKWHIAGKNFHFFKILLSFLFGGVK